MGRLSNYRFDVRNFWRDDWEVWSSVLVDKPTLVREVSSRFGFVWWKKYYTFFDSLFSKFRSLFGFEEGSDQNLGLVFQRVGIFRFDLTLIELEIHTYVYHNVKGHTNVPTFPWKNSRYLNFWVQTLEMSIDMSTYLMYSQGSLSGPEVLWVYPELYSYPI